MWLAAHSLNASLFLVLGAFLYWKFARKPLSKPSVMVSLVFLISLRGSSLLCLPVARFKWAFFKQSSRPELNGGSPELLLYPLDFHEHSPNAYIVGQETWSVVKKFGKCGVLSSEIWLLKAGFSELGEDVVCIFFA